MVPPGTDLGKTRFLPGATDRETDSGALKCGGGRALFCRCRVDGTFNRTGSVPAAGNINWGVRNGVRGSQCWSLFRMRVAAVAAV
jgi:hypothetical protein